ncbi:glycosyltransferase [Flavobacterium sp. Sd200]|uniref:glycosyltransferase n=1 Tax=Flavobacterium sp. Sd200 TaxID=2692211 RepID=UPI00136D65E2|nr:glycosyltransferase [Flavobacterium sp. Sd200]MXN92574.1 glycosyltransferase [Flavobacterium sp. Sd200]
MQKIAIIIPCYNEEKRIKKELVISLLQQSAVDVYLANDGSKDNTLMVLKDIAAVFSDRCFIINYEQNRGKAATIYNAANEIIEKNEYSHIGYFDADFSTPVREMLKMLRHLDRKPDLFITGCRVKLLNTNIDRKLYRHIIGRVIVTIMNFRFKLGVYDTQCGAKIFPVSIAKTAFSMPFLTSWLFDMEIFIRLKNKGLMHNGQEFPLKTWTDVEGSKLSWKTAFKILKEMYLLVANYSIKTPK